MSVWKCLLLINMQKCISSKLLKCLGFVRQLMEWTTPLMGTSIQAPDEQQGSSIFRRMNRDQQESDLYMYHKRREVAG
jgi:hypothetical protein